MTTGLCSIIMQYTSHLETHPGYQMSGILNWPYSLHCALAVARLNI